MPFFLMVVFACAALIALFYLLVKKNMIDLSGQEWLNKEALIKGDERNYNKANRDIKHPSSTTSSISKKTHQQVDEQKPAYDTRDREYLDNLIK